MRRVSRSVAFLAAVAAFLFLGVVHSGDVAVVKDLRHDRNHRRRLELRIGKVWMAFQLQKVGGVHHLPSLAEQLEKLKHVELARLNLRKHHGKAIGQTHCNRPKVSRPLGVGNTCMLLFYGGLGAGNKI